MWSFRCLFDAIVRVCVDLLEKHVHNVNGKPNDYIQMTAFRLFIDELAVAITLVAFYSGLGENFANLQTSL